MASPCCEGAGRFTAGGTLAPVLLNGFVPSAGQEFDLFALDGGQFEVAFAAVANGFSADYSHATSEPAYVGAVYGSAAGGASTGGASTGGAAGAASTGSASPALAHVSSISGSHGRITIRISCPSGGSACSAETLRATVTEHLKNGRITAVSAGAKKGARTKTVVIASASSVLAAGTTRTLTLTLNASGRALLAKYGKLTAIVTISAGTKTVQKLTVHVLRPAKPKKK